MNIPEDKVLQAVRSTSTHLILVARSVPMVSEIEIGSGSTSLTALSLSKGRQFQLSRTTSRPFWICVLLGLCFAFAEPSPAWAIQLKPHPISDLIEGDERTPPEGPHIVEERPATPAYPLPNTTEFSTAKATQTYPKEKIPEAGGLLQEEDIWDDWSSWDEWSDAEDWSSWDEEWGTDEIGGEAGRDESVIGETNESVEDKDSEVAAQPQTVDDEGWDSWWGAEAEIPGNGEAADAPPVSASAGEESRPPADSPKASSPPLKK